MLAIAYAPHPACGIAFIQVTGIVSCLGTLSGTNRTADGKNFQTMVGEVAQRLGLWHLKFSPNHGRRFISSI